jgi:hypothetical protein
MTTAIAACTGPGSRLVQSDSGASFLRLECAQCHKHHEPPPAVSTLEREVRAELAKKGNERVIVALHDSGTTRTFLAPKPRPVDRPLTPQQKFEASRPYASKAEPRSNDDATQAK